MWLPILLAAMTAVVTIYTIIEQENDKIKAEEEATREKESADRFQEDLRKANISLLYETQKNSAKTDSLAAANLENFKLSQQLNAKSDDIIKSNGDVIKAQIEMFKHVTGDGTPEIKFGGSKTDSYMLDLENMSNYPMYDIQIEQIHLSELAKVPTVNIDGVNFIDGIALESLTDPLSNFLPLPSKKSLPLTLKLKKNKDYDFVLYKITTRHGTFMQYCAIRNIPEYNLIEYNFILFRLVDGEHVEIKSNLDSVRRKFFTDNCPFYKTSMKIWRT
ncbi:hypothetical protein AMR72_16400 [Flavobacterium psychrophilum]|nr:hypothetical protein AMR72_16400 [Flavobacterium psychrophilum]AOE53945.1 hypothetical protein ALW18_16390 [Flavobacterium psychrophilum]